MNVSQEVRKRLLNAKYFLRRARRMQAEHLDLSIAMSLLLVHDAVEMLMLAVIDHLHVPTSKKRDFMDFWKEIRDLGHPEPPYRTAIDQLNSLRVGLKHKGSIPRAQTVTDLMPRIEAFCADAVRDYVAIEFETLSLADLVEPPDVRDFLRKADEEYAKGEKQQAIIQVRMAFDALLRGAYKTAPQLKSQVPRIPSGLPGEAGKILKAVFTLIKSLEFRVNASLLGIDPIRHSRFVSRTPVVQYAYSGDATVVLQGNYSQMPESVFRECYEFVVDSALNIEQRFGKIEESSSPNDPFGHDQG